MVLMGPPTPRGAAIGLAAITLFGIGLRCLSLNFPSALTDEAFTFWRICGTFNQLLDNLRLDAFVPLHYEVLWVLSRWLGTDLWVLRLPAAVAGAVMPYAVYRAGRIVCGRRVGLIAALLAAVSPFMGVFSRNAKMYMSAWTLLMLALGSVACFALARRRSRSARLALLTFIFFGMAAAATQAVVCIPLAMSPLIAAAWARRYRLRAATVALVATACVLAPTVLYYTALNTWFTHAGGLSGRTENGPAPRDNGLGWIDRWQADRSATNILLECASDYLAGFEWPGDDERFEGPPARRIQLTAEVAGAALVVCAIIAIGFAVASGRGGLTLPSLLGGLLLIACPLYAFYLRSFRSLLPPWRGGWVLWVALALTTVGLWSRDRRRRNGLWKAWNVPLLWLLCVATATILTWAGARLAYARAPLQHNGQPVWNPLWMPRYSGFIAPLLCVAVAAIIAATPTRPLRAALLAAVVGVNLWVTVLGLTWYTEPPWPLFCRDILSASKANNHTVAAVDWIYWPGQMFMYSLPAPYYALAREAKLEIDPPGFRANDTWPYVAGPTVTHLLKSLRVTPAAMLPATLARTRPETVLLWRSGRNLKPYTLPPGWHLTSRQSFPVRSVWTWEPSYTFERLVLQFDATR